MYKRMTLGELIESLRELPEGSEVHGISDSIRSYRGYYERNAVAPEWAAGNRDPRQLASTLEGQIGKKITGYKGGDYKVDPRELVYLADYGDIGPGIIGLEADAGSGVFAPVLLADDWH